jgi:hypothetical protein
VYKWFEIEIVWAAAVGLGESPRSLKQYSCLLSLVVGDYWESPAHYSQEEAWLNLHWAQRPFPTALVWNPPKMWWGLVELFVQRDLFGTRTEGRAVVEGEQTAVARAHLKGVLTLEGDEEVMEDEGTCRSHGNEGAVSSPGPFVI